MGDEHVRSLEREAASGDFAAALRYARALERDDRRAEAGRVLRRFVDHPEARAELARYPAWTHAQADAGRTSYLDVAPVLSAPRVLWKTVIPQLQQWNDGSLELVASPLGVVCSTNRGLSVHDPDTGFVLWNGPATDPSQRSVPEDPLGGASVEMTGEELRVSQRGLVRRYDVLRGDDRGALSVAEGAGLIAGGVLYAPDGRGSLVARGVGSGAEGEVIWRAPCDEGDHRVGIAAAAQLVFAETSAALHVFDRASGVTRRAFVGARLGGADEHGFVVLMRGASPPGRFERAEHYAYDGRLVRNAPWGLVMVLAPRFAVGVATDIGRVRSLLAANARFAWRDRTDGDAPLVDVEGTLPIAVAAARDVVYAYYLRQPTATFALLACRPGGRLLWDLDLEPIFGAKVRDSESAVATVDRVIYVAANRALVALTDLPP